MRVYLPATLVSLRSAFDAGKLGPAPITAYAVTPALREWYVEGDAEELEYAAMMAAARRSLRLLANESQAPRRRVVVAADAVDHDVRPVGTLDSDPASVTIGTPVPIEAVVSAHVDDSAAATDVAAAVAALRDADAGDADAAFTVDGAEGHELAWYAVQEIPDLLR